MIHSDRVIYRYEEAVAISLLKVVLEGPVFSFPTTLRAFPLLLLLWFYTKFIGLITTPKIILGQILPENSWTNLTRKFLDK